MKRFLTLGLVKGILGAVVGAGIGLGLTTAIRALMGLAAWHAEAASAVASATGLLGFLVGLGAFADWWRWARGAQAGHPAHPAPDQPHWTRYFSFDPNHKIIGLQYAVAALLFLSIAGVMAMVIRTELSAPGLQVVSADAYNTTMSLHGIVMISAILVGIAGLTNYLLPIMIGAQDMAFPRLNALSFWLVPPAVSTPAGRAIRRWAWSPRWAPSSSTWASSSLASPPSSAPSTFSPPYLSCGRRA
jgi:cytochrome c oxidase subunit 1